MTRNTWLWLAAGLTSAALAATFVFNPFTPAPATVQRPAATLLGWIGQVRLVAGDGVLGARDGTGGQARFADPYGIARANDGTLYVADAGDNNHIRAIAVDGTVSTLAGGVEGFVDGSGATAAFNTPSGLALDRAGNLYVADTGNHAIRKVTPAGVVSTLAGDGTPGYRDGVGRQARFNGPIGVAVSGDGRVYVADTYNDRIRVIAPDGRVTTLAGGERPGDQDGIGAEARFDTPSALAVDDNGMVWVADTRNNAIRRVTPAGVVSTLLRNSPDAPLPTLYRPLSLAVTHDGVLYFGELTTGRVLQLTVDGRLAAISGDGGQQRLSRPAGLVLDRDGALYATDAGSYRVHRIAPLAPGAGPAAAALGPSAHNPLPDTRGRWPLRPQDGWHEVVGNLGEVRGSYREQDSRHHLHDGLDIRGDIGQEVVAIADAKVSSPTSTWTLGGVAEGLSLDTLGYIHMRVGRTALDRVLDPSRFHLLTDEDGRPERMRVPRGTRFKAGDVLGTINSQAHVHLTLGASGYERNAVALGFAGYADSYPPRIDRVELLDATGQPLTARQDGHLLLPRDTPGLQLVVDAWDQVDRNLPRRRLGLYALGYQLLDAAGQPLPGHVAPSTGIEFNRMPTDPDAVKVAYAEGSGITAHGSAVTRFRYLLSNSVRDGAASSGLWRPGVLPAGDYLLRITARDYSGNVAIGGRDLPLRLQ